jgi:hypothetical protein
MYVPEENKVDILEKKVFVENFLKTTHILVDDGKSKRYNLEAWFFSRNQDFALINDPRKPLAYREG